MKVQSLREMTKSFSHKTIWLITHPDCNIYKLEHIFTVTYLYNIVKLRI